jgi:hypothetical protein
MSRTLVHSREQRSNNLAVSTRAPSTVLMVLRLLRWSAALDPTNELTLNGEWELAEVEDDLSPGVPDLSGIEWKRVRLPVTVQYSLFQAGSFLEI